MPEHHLEEWWECKKCWERYPDEADALACEKALPDNAIDVQEGDEVIALVFLTLRGEEEWVRGTIKYKYIIRGGWPMTHRYSYTVKFGNRELLTDQIRKIADGESDA